MNAEFFNKIWEILVRHAGQREDNRERLDFIRCLTQQWDSQNVEWRFCGALGFGGKLYYNNNGLYVNCYTEDLNPKREQILQTTNSALRMLHGIPEKI